MGIRCSVPCLQILLLILLCLPAWAEDWPTCLHDNQRSGVTAEEIRPPLALRWEFRSPFPPAPGWAPLPNGYGVRKNKADVSYDDAFRLIAVGDTVYLLLIGREPPVRHGCRKRRDPLDFLHGCRAAPGARVLEREALPRGGRRRLPLPGCGVGQAPLAIQGRADWPADAGQRALLCRYGRSARAESSRTALLTSPRVFSLQTTSTSTRSMPRTAHCSGGSRLTRRGRGACSPRLHPGARRLALHDLAHGAGAVEQERRRAHGLRHAFSSGQGGGRVPLL